MAYMNAYGREQLILLIGVFLECFLFLSSRVGRAQMLGLYQKEGEWSALFYSQ